MRTQRRSRYFYVLFVYVIFVLFFVLCLCPSLVISSISFWVVSAALPNSGQRWWVACKKQGVLTQGSAPDSRHPYGWGVSISSVVFPFLVSVSFGCRLVSSTMLVCPVCVSFFVCVCVSVLCRLRLFHLRLRVQALNTIYIQKELSYIIQISINPNATSGLG